MAPSPNFIGECAKKKNGHIEAKGKTWCRRWKIEAKGPPEGFRGICLLCFLLPSPCLHCEIVGVRNVWSYAELDTNC
jgi:hypothetical protein